MSIIPIKNPLKHKSNIKCSFCGEIRSCVESLISHKSICCLCHQNAKEILGKIHPNAVQCLRCQQFDSIVIEMENKSQIHYNSPGLDINGTTFYVISKIEGKFSDKSKKKEAHCGHCKKVIPLYLLSRNSYIL